MRIGEEVFVHGYVDEIRGDTVIIKNDGGYFGTALSEIYRDHRYVTREDVGAMAAESLMAHMEKRLMEGGDLDD